MNKRRKDKTVFVGFYSAKGGVGKTTCLFSLLCLITGNGTKNIDKICIVNCDRSSLSIKALLKETKISRFDEQNNFEAGVCVENNSVDGLLSFATKSLYAPELKNVRYVLIDFAGFQMKREELTEAKKVVDLWIIPVYPSTVSNYSTDKVYQDLFDIDVPKEQIITFVNKLKPSKDMNQEMLNNVREYIRRSGVLYPQEEGFIIESEYLPSLENLDKAAISLTRNKHCRKVFEFCYSNMKTLWRSKNTK